MHLAAVRREILLGIRTKLRGSQRPSIDIHSMNAAFGRFGAGAGVAHCACRGTGGPLAILSFLLTFPSMKRSALSWTPSPLSNLRLLSLSQPNKSDSLWHPLSTGVTLSDYTLTSNCCVMYGE